MWIKVKKETCNSIVSDYISVRSSKTIAISSSLCKKLNITSSDYSEFFINESGEKIMIKFYKERNTKDCFSLSSDGGGINRKTNSLVIQSPSIFKTSKRLTEISNKKDKNDKKIYPSKIGINYVEFYLKPNFEHSSENSSPKEEEMGIYQLIKNKEIVYIGKGKIKNRVSSHKRNGLDFDFYKYSILLNDEDCIKLESEYIENYIYSNNQLPLYNNIKGANIG